MNRNEFIMENYIAAVNEMDIAEIGEFVRRSIELNGSDFKAEIVAKYIENGYNKGLITEEEYEEKLALIQE